MQDSPEAVVPLGEDEVMDDNLVTPQSGIDEEFSYSHSAGVDSDLAELPEGELRDSWPLVSTPAVTRLLSFSRVASPAGSMRTSIGYGGPAVPASVQRRSRRLAGRDATVAAVGVVPCCIGPCASTGQMYFHTMSPPIVTSRNSPTVPEQMIVCPFGRRWAPEMFSEYMGSADVP